MIKKFEKKKKKYICPEWDSNPDPLALYPDCLQNVCPFPSLTATE